VTRSIQHPADPNQLFHAGKPHYLVTRSIQHPADPNQLFHAGKPHYPDVFMV
jgi:hypothetical protein